MHGQLQLDYGHPPPPLAKGSGHSGGVPSAPPPPPLANADSSTANRVNNPGRPRGRAALSVHLASPHAAYPRPFVALHLHEGSCNKGRPEVQNL